MASTEKLTDTNAILAYLYEKFPLCFVSKGEAKPLKIGLFQDLVATLADDENISKTQLRVAIRRYTNSWRYLKSLKPGGQRVDLNGNACGELDAAHIEHARTTLKESQQRAKERRLAQAQKASVTQASSEDSEPAKPDAQEGVAQEKTAQVRRPAKSGVSSKNSVDKSRQSKPKHSSKKSTQPHKGKKKSADETATSFRVPKSVSELQQSQRVNIKLGAAPMAGIIVDIKKEEVQVQLDTGLTVKVRAEHILL